MRNSQRIQRRLGCVLDLDCSVLRECLVGFGLVRLLMGTVGDSGESSSDSGSGEPLFARWILFGVGVSPLCESRGLFRARRRGVEGSVLIRALVAVVCGSRGLTGNLLTFGIKLVHCTYLGALIGGLGHLFSRLVAFATHLSGNILDSVIGPHSGYTCLCL